MQQQALVAQSAYLSPVATVAAVQMQQLAALNPNSIIATPIASITPSSGNGACGCLAPAQLPFDFCLKYEDRLRRFQEVDISNGQSFFLFYFRLSSNLTLKK